MGDVHDGDTLRLQDGRRIRLWGIDAPELKQAYGIQSRDYLRQVVGKVVQLEPHGEDRYGRMLAVVRLGRRCLNEELLARGLAWWYRKYTPDEKRYEQLEAEAHRKGLGLWGAAHMPPWEWRHR